MIGRRGTAVTFVLALFVLLRAPFLLDDPPAELVSHYQDVAFSIFDEGWWTANARELRLFGNLLGTGFDLFWVSPLFTGIVSVAFAAFGVSFASARAVSIATGLLGIWVLASIPSRRANERPSPRTGTLAAFLWGVSFACAHLGRLAVPETTGTLFGLAGAALLLHKNVPSTIAAGACAALAALVKPQFSFLVPALFAGSIVLALRDGRRVVPRALQLAAGAAVPWTLWGFYAVLHAEEAFGMMSFYRAERWFAGRPESLTGVIAILKPAVQVILSGIIYRHLFFVHFPVVFLLAAAACPSIFAAALRPRRVSSVSDAAIVFGLWAIIGGLFISAIPYQPLRYYLPLVPALAYLAAWRLLEAPGEEGERARLLLIARWIVSFFVLAQLLFAAAAPFVVPALVAKSAVGRVELLHPEPFSITSFLIGLVKNRSLDGFAALPRELAYIAAMAMLALASLSGAAVIAFLARRRVAGISLPPFAPRVRAFCLAALLTVEALHWARWLPERAQSLPAMSRDLATCLDPSAVVSPAGTYSLGNALRYDSHAVRELRMFDATGTPTHFLVLAEHPLIGRLAEDEIERRYPGARFVRRYTLTGEYVYDLYERAPR
jgi:4-amino-4-deoxy-L-arabinose transferase-like glycosyltransferase